MMELYGDGLPVHPRTGLAAIGLLADGRPVWPVAGGSGPLGEPPAGGDPDDGDDDGDEPDDDASGDGGDGQPPAKWTPPTEAEWDALVKKRERANKEAARRRAENDKLKAELEAAKNTPPPADAAADKKTAAELTALREKADGAAVREKAALRAAARAAILAAGYTGAQDGRMMVSMLGMVNYGDLVFDGGEIGGLDDQVDAIKEELPDLFRKPETTEPAKKRVPKADAGGKNPPPKPASWIDSLHKQMKGG